MKKSDISIFPNEPKVNNTEKIYFTEEKISVPLIFEEKNLIGRHLEFFWRQFFQKNQFAI
jgi:hypothetical protein